MKQEAKYVYISGPLTTDADGDPVTEAEQKQNVWRAMAVCFRLLEMGHYPYCPHLNYYLGQFLRGKGIGRTADEFYLPWDVAWVSKCDVLLRLGKSHGSDVELEVAEENELEICTHITDIIPVGKEVD